MLAELREKYDKLRGEYPVGLAVKVAEYCKENGISNKYGGVITSNLVRVYMMHTKPHRDLDIATAHVLNEEDRLRKSRETKVGKIVSKI